MRVRRLAMPGDVVAIHPPWLSPMTRWYFGVRTPGPKHLFAVPGLEADALLLGDASWDGTVWLVEPTEYDADTPGLVPCRAPWVRDGYRMRCLRRGA